MSAAAAAWLPGTTVLVISRPSSCRQHREGAARALRRAQPAAFAVVRVERAVSLAHVGQDAFGAVDDALLARRAGAAAEAALRFLIRGLPVAPVAEALANLEEACPAPAGRQEPAAGHGDPRDVAEREGGGIDERRRARFLLVGRWACREAAPGGRVRPAGAGPDEEEPRPGAGDTPVFTAGDLV